MSAMDDNGFRLPPTPRTYPTKERGPTKSAILAAKRDLLAEAARQFAAGTLSFDDLEVAAVEDSEALADKAMEHLRGIRR